MGKMKAAPGAMVRAARPVMKTAGCGCNRERKNEIRPRPMTLLYVVSDVGASAR